MTEFRFIGRLEFMGRSVPVDLRFDCSTLDLMDALGGLVCYPDDPSWQETIALASGPETPLPERRRLNLANPDLFDELIPGDDERNWLVIAERFPDLFKEESGPVPGLPAPPKSQADIDKMRRRLDQEELESDFEADLAKLLAIPRKELLKTDGTVNASEVARRTNRRTGGSDWPYVQELSAHLQAHYDEEDQKNETDLDQWAVA